MEAEQSESEMQRAIINNAAQAGLTTAPDIQLISDHNVQIQDLFSRQFCDLSIFTLNVA